MTDTMNTSMDPRQQHSYRVQAYIADIIQREGPIPFRRFMAEALYSPGLGYYRSGQHKLGERGDFVTAPEISPLFSYSLARQCQQILQQLGEGSILEIGPGSGVMAADVLRALEEADCLPQTYWLLELSSDLAALQQHTLEQRVPHLLHKVEWLSQWPPVFDGVVLANEVLDAMPVHLFHYQKGEFGEYYVDVDSTGQLRWHLDGLSESGLERELMPLKSLLADGHTAEINPAVKPWLQGLADCLRQGLVLVIDYGFPRHEYYHPQRHMGTLMCHSRHHAHSDPLAMPGAEDITAHVDFTAAAECALEAGFDIAGFCTQADFLINCGITHLLNTDSEPRTYYSQTQQLKMLTLPSEMGELFKVLGLSRKIDPMLMGFVSNDQRHRLG